MAFRFNFNEEKNQLLKVTREVGFEDVMLALKNDRLLTSINHPNKQRVHQKIFVVEINNYAYVVPYVRNESKKEIFLKTIYPSRVFTRKYLLGVKDEKTNK